MTFSSMEKPRVRRLEGVKEGRTTAKGGERENDNPK